MDGSAPTLAERIFLARRRLGENQTVFGTRFNVKRLSVNKWEDGTVPSREHLVQLQRLFKDLFDDETRLHNQEPAYQMLLPFDQPVNLEFRISPHSAQEVSLEVQIRRKVS